MPTKMTVQRRAVVVAVAVAAAAAAAVAVAVAVVVVSGRMAAGRRRTAWL